MQYQISKWNIPFIELTKQNPIAKKIFHNYLLISLYVLQNILEELFKQKIFVDFTTIYKKIHKKIPPNIDFYISSNLSILLENFSKYPLNYCYIFYTELLEFDDSLKLNQIVKNHCKSYLSQKINTSIMDSNYLLITNVLDDYYQKFINKPTQL